MGAKQNSWNSPQANNARMQGQVNNMYQRGSMGFTPGYQRNPGETVTADQASPALDMAMQQRPQSRPTTGVAGPPAFLGDLLTRSQQPVTPSPNAAMDAFQQFSQQYQAQQQPRQLSLFDIMRNYRG